MLKTLLVLLFVLASTVAAAAELQGRVVWIYDGDTIEVKNIGKVRLLGIDTPEYKDSQRDYFYMKRFHISRQRLRKIAKAAKYYNIDHVKGKIVSLETEGTTHDKHGRLLAYVYLPGRHLLNETLLQQGLASVFRRFDFGRKQSFFAAEEQAKKAQVGLWAEE